MACDDGRAGGHLMTSADHSIAGEAALWPHGICTTCSTLKFMVVALGHISTPAGQMDRTQLVLRQEQEPVSDPTASNAKIGRNG